MCRKPTEGLTPRELEITQYLACGLTHKEIAERINRSVSTVSNTLRVLYEKLRLNKESEVVAYYLCTYHGADSGFDKIGKIRRAIGASLLAVIVALQVVAGADQQMIRTATRTARRRTEERSSYTL